VSARGSPSLVVIERFRRWCGKMVDVMDTIALLQVAAGIGSKSAAARLREIEDDSDQSDIIRAAAQKAWEHARWRRCAYDMAFPGDIPSGED